MDKLCHFRRAQNADFLEDMVILPRISFYRTGCQKSAKLTTKPKLGGIGFGASMTQPSSIVRVKNPILDQQWRIDGVMERGFGDGMDHGRWKLDRGFEDDMDRGRWREGLEI